MTQSFHHSFFFMFSLGLAAVLTVMPLPEAYMVFRPEWIAAVMFFWTLRYPQHIGQIISWMVGIVWDVLVNSPLGLHALTLSIQAYLVAITLQRVQMYPVVQQSLVVFMLVGIQLMVYRWLMAIFDMPAIDLEFLWAALTTALVWPLVSVVMHRIAYDG